MLNARYYRGGNKPAVDFPIYAIDKEDEKILEENNAVVSVETVPNNKIALYIDMNGEEHMVLADSKIKDGSRAAIKECLALFTGKPDA